MASRIALATLALLTAGLAGCAHEKVAEGGYRWAYLEAPQDAPRLAYGRPNSDDVVLMISCRPGQDQVDVSALGLSGSEIVLTSGRNESRFPADALEDEVSGGKLLEGRGRTSAPALANFRKSGNLALLTKGERHDLAAGSADQGHVKAFFKACGA
jgi:hypothetical protein